MRLQYHAIVVALLASGCANQQLRISTVRQSTTLPDLQERQVIANFARLAANPGDLPFFSVVNQGTATVTDTGSASVAVTAVHKAFPLWDVTPASASRSINENWQLVPENNPDRLKAMRAAYLRVFNPTSIEPRDDSLLESALQADQSYAPTPGWLSIGSWWDVPKHACFVGHCGSVYVWVMPENLAEFSRFVLLILHIETVAPGGTAAGPSAAAAPMPIPAAAPPAPFAPRLFDQPTGVNTGLFFVPRPP
jgi:hypothetical protein